MRIANSASHLRSDRCRHGRLVLCGILLAIAMSGCGGAEEVVKTVTVERPVTPDRPGPGPPTHPKSDGSQPGSPAPPASGGFVQCDPNIQAKESTTSCEFAENVFWHYWMSGASTSLRVWSPATQSTFNTTCDSDGDQVVCTTSDDGAVKFSQAALDLYSEAQANAYASGHDLGPDPYETLPSTPPPGDGGEGAGGGDDCQGYDPCITTGSDVDCSGGSGNGPRYVEGPVSVTGDDPYGLDSDGNGVGCQ